MLQLLRVEFQEMALGRESITESAAKTPGIYATPAYVGYDLRRKMANMFTLTLG